MTEQQALLSAILAHPVERVTLTDREPWDRLDGQFSWYSEGDHDPAHCLPLPLFDTLTNWAEHAHAFGRKTYPTRDAALDALSIALIRWAKSP